MTRRFGGLLIGIVCLSLLAAACGGGGATTATEGGGGGGGAEKQVQLDRPLTFVVAFGPGGGSDQVARAAAPVMEDVLGIQLPVVNVPGSTGNVGMRKLITTPPGRAMALLIQDTLATVPLGTSSFQLDQIQGVCRLQRMPSALLVKKGTYDSWKELEAAAKANPGQVKVATVGRGGIDRLMLAVLSDAQGTTFSKVPFSQPSERYAALLGGHVDVLYEQLGDVRQYLDSGKFKPVVIFSKDIVHGYEKATYATELGVPKSSVLPQFRGLVMRAKTDPALVETISDACKKVMEDPKFREFQENVFASEDSYMPAKEFERFINQQKKIIRKLMKKYGVIE